MLKRIASLAIVGIIALVSVLPVFAQSNAAGFLRIGDTMALPDGSEATLVGLDIRGNQTWQANLGQPVYLPGTRTKYDAQWHANSDGSYTSGANTIAARISDESVTVSYKGKESTWTPNVAVGTSSKRPIGKAKLGNDPYDWAYSNNTLTWDLGNGVKRQARLIEGELLEYYVVDRPQNGTLQIRSNQITDDGFMWHRPVVATDADNNPVPITVSNGVITLADNPTILSGTSKQAKAKYPITIDPDTSIYTSTSDGFIYVTGRSTWASAHDAASGDYLQASSTNLDVRAGYGYDIMRSFLFFDTSSLSGYTITSANLSIYSYNYFAQLGAWTLRVQSNNSTYPHDPLSLSDFSTTYYSGDGGSLLSANMTTSGYKNIALTATGLSWIKQTGVTKLALRELEHDVNNVDSGVNYNQNGIWFYSYEQGASYRPKLVVTFNAAAASIAANPASVVAKYSARLNSQVTADGGESCQVRWGYGTTSQTAANFSLYANNTTWSEAIWTVNQNPYLDVTGLSANTTYYYRVQIQNSSGIVTSSEVSFTTLTSVSAPTNVSGIPAQTSIELAWTRGDGTTGTLVRYSSSDFPVLTTDGTFGYNGTATHFTLTNLSPGKTYRFTLFGEASGNYTSGVNLAVTTNLYAITIDSEDNSVASPLQPTVWFLTADYTKMIKLEPIYSMVNNIADSWGMPKNTAWMGVATILVIIIMLAGAKAGGMWGAFVGCLLGFGVAVMMSMYPLALILFVIIFIVFVVALKDMGVQQA